MDVPLGLQCFSWKVVLIILSLGSCFWCWPVSVSVFIVEGHDRVDTRVGIGYFKCVSPV